MREPRPITGARAPLFERLADLDRASPREPVPLRILDRDALVASVAVEIACLFNTRAPRPERLADPGPICVLDYGAPDFGGYDAASAPDRERYAAVLTRVLLAFEPRLSQVSIILEPLPGDPARLAGALSAQVRVGTVREPVSFPLLLHAKSGELRLGEEPGERAAASGAIGAA